MAKVSDFLPYVVPFVPGCPNTLAEQHIRDACIDFCTYSGLVKEALDPVTARAGVQEYDLESPSTNDLQVRLIQRAWFRGKELVVVNLDDQSVRPELYNKRFTGASASPGEPTTLIQTAEQTFIFDRAPELTEAAAITIVATVKPTRTATTLPDILFQDYAAEIGQGAVATLQTVPNQPFTDLTTVEGRAGIFRAAKDLAKIRALRSIGRSQSRVQMRPFA